MPSVAPLRPEWNAQGPHLPCWFVLRLESFDPDLVLQFIPCWDDLAQEDKRYGMNPAFCPQGAWHIFRRQRPGWVHRLAVFSLVDRVGHYVEPNMDVLRLLRMSRALWRSRESAKMHDMLEESIANIKSERAGESKHEMMRRLDEKLVTWGRRQFHHRVAVPGQN